MSGYSGYPSAFKTFLSAPRYAVVGASNDRSKWGNKVLRWYQDRQLDVTPVHPKESHVEGLEAVKEATDLPDLGSTSISIIVNSSIGFPLLQRLFPEGTSSSPNRTMSPRAVWFQPGAESDEIAAYVKRQGLEDRVVFGGPCVLVMGDGVREELAREKDGERRDEPERRGADGSRL